MTLLSLESEIEEWVIGCIHKEDAAGQEQEHIGDDLTGADRECKTAVAELELLESIVDGEAADDCGEEKPAIILHRKQYQRIGKFVAVTADKVPEELQQPIEILEIEDTKSDENNNFTVNMSNDKWNLFHTLLADQLFNQNKQAEIQTPDNEIPACAVPESGTEPDEE